MGKLRDAWAVIVGKASLASAVQAGVAQVGQAVSPSRDLRQLVKEGYKKNVVVFHCIDELANGVAHTPLLLKRKIKGGDLLDITDHPVFDLMDNPNPEQTFEEVMYALIANYGIGGNAYLEAVGRDEFGREPRELWVKRPDRMRVVPGRTMVQAYEFRVGGGAVVKWPVDMVSGRSAILHLKTFAPLDEFYGMSPLESAALNVDTHNEGDKWNYNLLRKGATKAGVVSSDKSLGDDQFKTLRKRLNEQSGSESAGEHLLITGPNLKWTDMGITPRELMQVENKELTARFICLAYNYPPFLLGLPGGATFNNVAEAKLHFWDATQVPLIKKVVEKLNKWLLSKYPNSEGLMFVPDFDNVPAMETRREQTWTRMDKGLLGGIITANEARVSLGLTKREGEPLADALRWPATFIPSNDEAPPGSEEDGDDDEADDDEAKKLYGDLKSVKVKHGNTSK